MEDSILCCANAQSMKFYFNEDEYGILPEDIKKALKIAAVTYCSDAGGTLVFSFDAQHKLHLQAIDPIDEIGSDLLIRRMQRDMGELFEQLETFAAEYAKLKTEQKK